MSSNAQKAAAGANFLDGVKPGWFNQINPDTLNIRDANFCPFGQLYGGYFKGVEETGVGWVSLTSSEGVYELGFNCEPWNNDSLVQAWCQEIEKRKTGPTTEIKPVTSSLSITLNGVTQEVSREFMVEYLAALPLDKPR